MVAPGYSESRYWEDRSFEVSLGKEATSTNKAGCAGVHLSYPLQGNHKQEDQGQGPGQLGHQQKNLLKKYLM
jgi:hypothetical protein